MALLLFWVAAVKFAGVLLGVFLGVSKGLFEEDAKAGKRASLSELTINYLTEFLESYLLITLDSISDSFSEEAFSLTYSL
jgi:hypothetical protein